jgi:tetratricopeptide (TPR) repeat protein
VSGVIRGRWLLAAVLATAACGGGAEPTTPAVDPSPAAFVGSERCAACHRAAFEAWRASHHALAMQPPTRSAVVAPFAGEAIAHAGVRSTFSTSGDRFLVRTDGPDGRLAEFPVKYVFGISPLQQYLIELPGGRIQALGLSWDSRPPDVGGGRWFHLYRGEPVRAGDPLHWTGARQNWNGGCADCHSTNVRKNYDAATRRYATTYSEISVGCEACHGPASTHVTLAEGQALRAGAMGLRPALDERRGVSWGRTATGQPVRSARRETQREIEVCARCHSRRTQLTDRVSAADSLHDGFRVALLDPGLFHPDGQMREEVYNYGSFLQSRMCASGVTCSDCHDPHSGQVRLSGNAICLTCHDAPAYDGPQHHLHAPGTPGASCISCHMPTTTYMSVDPRHDHSLRVPRPDRSAALGTPDACSACHAREGPAWAAEVIRKRRPSGSRGSQSFAEAFASFDRGGAAASAAVAGIASDRAQPAIVRASALARLERAGMAVAPGTLEAAARDDSALVRLAAAGFPNPSTLGLLLGDPLLSVRIEAAGALARLPAEELPPALAGVRVRALEEYAAVQRFNADQPEAQLNLATALAGLGRIAEAVEAAREALRLDPAFVPAYVNLADLHRMQRDDEAAERVLREGLRHAWASGAVHHALGLTLVRRGRLGAALAPLRDAMAREPANARFALVYAVALHDAGRPADAIRVLKALLAQHPDHAEARAALQSYLSR